MAFHTKTPTMISSSSRAILSSSCHLRRTLLLSNHHNHYRHQLLHLQKQRYLSSLSTNNAIGLSTISTFTNPLLPPSPPPSRYNNCYLTNGIRNFATGRTKRTLQTFITPLHKHHYHHHPTLSQSHRYKNTKSTTTTTNNANNSTGTTRSYQQSKPPSSKSSILPTLDASPLFDPILHVQRSKASLLFRTNINNPADRHHENASTSTTPNNDEERDRRLVMDGRTQIRNWILCHTPHTDTQPHPQHPSSSSSSSVREDDLLLLAEEESHESCHGRKRWWREFALVGHGVPMQLLQCCVDSAWEILELVGSGGGDGDGDGDGGKGGGERGGGGVNECFLRGDGDSLALDCMTIRTKDGKYESVPWPIVLNNTNLLNNLELQSEMEDLQHSLQIYLTVMTRIASAFADLTKPNDTEPNPPNITLNDDYNLTLSSTFSRPTIWKADLLKGFVYPPSATIFSTAFWNDGEDCSSGQRIGDLTSPPIVQLTCEGDEDGEMKTVVRVTLQGIHSGGMEMIEDDGSDSRAGGMGRGMVPVSLVFEACFGSIKYDDESSVI